MKNIFKTQLYLCKQRKGLIGVIWLVAVVAFILLLFLKDNAADVFGNSVLPMFIISALPAFMIAYNYTEKIQIYEITSGYKPHEIVFGKTLAYLPFTISFLVAVFIASLIRFGAASLTFIPLFCILTIRMTLCVIFLSTLTKGGAWIPLLSGMVATFFKDTQALQNSPVSFLAAGQCALLNQPIDNAFILKVVISSIVACVIYYVVGHMVVKKKFDLEPRK